MAKYRKLIAVVVGSLVALIAQYLGPDTLPAPELLTQGIILALTAFGVYAAPNAQA